MQCKPILSIDVQAHSINPTTILLVVAMLCLVDRRARDLLCDPEAACGGNAAPAGEDRAKGTGRARAHRAGTYSE